MRRILINCVIALYVTGCATMQGGKLGEVSRIGENPQYWMPLDLGTGQKALELLSTIFGG